MKWSITYFSNIRYMNAHQLPLSTAVFPPKFFKQTHINKNDVVLGITCTELVPKQQCECPCNSKDYNSCDFLKTYYHQLSHIDFTKFIDNVELFVSKLENITFVDIDEIVLLVYERPDNLCSERTVLKKWFKDNGIILNEMEAK